jgi:hypothetical protein
LCGELFKGVHHTIKYSLKKTKNGIYTMRMFDTFFKEFTTQSNTACKKTKNSIYTMRMFDTFFKEIVW